MGREAAGLIRFRGAEGAGKLLLEGAEILWRGALRGRVARTDLAGFQARGDDLVLETPEGPLVATLGSHEAEAWVRALAKPLPSLAAKLGLGPGRPIEVLGRLSDPVLIAAVKEHMGGAGAPQALAEVESAEALAQALARAGGRPLWVVTPKGRASPLPEAALRAAFGAAGWVDHKVCAVSDSRTATRLVPRGQSAAAAPRKGGLEGEAAGRHMEPKTS